MIKLKWKIERIVWNLKWYDHLCVYDILYKQIHKILKPNVFLFIFLVLYTT